MNVIDALYKALGDLGFTGTLPDRMFKHLGSLGHVGTMNDRLAKEGGYKEYVKSLIEAPVAPPVITLQPSNVTVDEGTPWNITSAATGATSSEWYKDGSPTGNTTNTFSGTGLLSESGNYFNRYSNVIGDTDTSTAVVSITGVNAPRYFIDFGIGASDSYMTLTTPITLTGDFRVTLIATPGAASNTGLLDGGTSNLRILSDGRIRVTTEGGGGGISAPAGSLPFDGQLHQIIVERISGNLTIFVDGLLRASSPEANNYVIDTIGKVFNSHDDIIADVVIEDLTGSTTTTFVLGEGVSNTENSVELNNSVTYINIATDNLSRGFYTFNDSLNRWEGDNGRNINVAY